jgi:transketolase
MAMEEIVPDTAKLKSISRIIRADIIKSLAEAGSGHTGGSLGLADIFTCLYFGIMRHRPEEPLWEERDRLILSIGHVAPVLYTTLAHAGYFPTEELKSLRKLGSRLQGHPGRDHGLPGLELSAGSLGQGLSVAVGMALAAKHANSQYRIFCIHGDGELQEGSIWEAAMGAAHYKLDNITAVVDRNGLQIDGSTDSVMEIEPLDKKWEAFGWQVIKCDGHDHSDILRAFREAKEIKEQPSVIIANTVMGKGVKSIEGDHHWHGRAPSRAEAALFLEELESTHV